MIGGIRGKVGNGVFVQTPGGTVVRQYVIPRNPRTPAQQLNRERWRTATLAWSMIGDAEFEAWVAYAKTLASRDPVTGLTKTPRPNNLFCVLYSKLLAVEPLAPPPAPPERVFFGDVAQVSASVSGRSIVFTADQVNAPSVVTELLVQPLVNSHRRVYQDKYRSQGFVAFAGGHLSESVTLIPRWYAVAYRFVNSTTGQETGLAELGILRVGG